MGGLTQKQIDEVESLALRIADAVAVRRIGTLSDVQEAWMISPLDPAPAQRGRNS